MAFLAACIFWLLVACVVTIVVGHIIAWILYVPMAVRVFGETPWLPAPWREPLDDGEDVEFSTDDGLRLGGTYLSSFQKIKKGVVLFCHELNGDRWSCAPYIEDLRQQGYDIFSFDFRNHGTSGRGADYEPLPWVTTFDLTDVRAAIDYLSSRPDADPGGIGLFGISKGGTVALCTAAYDPRVRALIVDGACPTERMQIYYVRRFAKIFASFSWLVTRLPDISLRSTNAWTRLVLSRRRKCRFVNVDVAARKIRQPVLMIHGRRDNHIPLEIVQDLRSTMSKGTKLWAISDAKHNGSISVARETYHRRIARFFQQNLTAPQPVMNPASALTRRERIAGRFRQSAAVRDYSTPRRSKRRSPVATTE
ncbi:MAG: alpha/beta fold hydrolase [Planctomycetota bacterium]|nr:alpha/beta fold hydrolase [Planctomycetota bacterium]